MRITRVGILAAVLFVSTSSVMAAIIDLRDGGVHDINYEIDCDVVVDYRSPGRGTTVNMLDGGVIMFPWKLVGFEDSIINVFGGATDLMANDNTLVSVVGGSMENVSAGDSSQIVVSDGTITGNLIGGDESRISVSGGSVAVLGTGYNSQATISDGSVLEVIRPYGHSQVDIVGGSVDQVWADDDSEVAVSGGSVSVLRTQSNSQAAVSGESALEFVSALDHSQVSIIGGAIDQVLADDTGQVTVSDGAIGYLRAGGTSQVDVSGGLFSNTLMLSEDAVLTIDGCDFAVDGLDVGYIELSSMFGRQYWNEPYRQLTGTLLNGDPLNWDFQIGNNARIVLVPEPGTVLLFGFGGLMLRRRRQT